MTRSELIDLLAKRFSLLTAKDVEASVKEITEAVGNTLVRRHRVEIRGFGSFSLNYRAPRIGRNPKSGALVNVSGKWCLHFKAGKEMRERIEASVLPERTRKLA